METIDGRIVVFESLAISRIIYLALVTVILTIIINLLNKIWMECIWRGKKFKN